MSILDILNNMPNLVDYMGQGRRGSNRFAGYGTTQVVDALQAANRAQAQSAAYLLDLSPEAQQALANDRAAESSSVIEGAQRHFIEFFADSGVDFENLSTEAEGLMDNILAFLAESGTTSRDAKTDAMELEFSKGDRNVYTLSGDNRRVRIAVEKTDDGTQLTLTDFQGRQADIAKITVSAGDDAGHVITVARSQENFAYGQRVSTEAQETLVIET